MDNEYFMEEALKEAKKAYKKEEVPVGAVIVKDGLIIAKAHNLKETKKNAIAHAEILAINKACKKLNNWRLENCIMYITLEPCSMCASAISQTRIDKVIVGALDPKPKEYTINMETGILKDKCEQILKDFFKSLRGKNG